VSEPASRPRRPVQLDDSRIRVEHLHALVGDAVHRTQSGGLPDGLLEDTDRALTMLVHELLRDLRNPGLNALGVRADLRRCAIVGRLLAAAVDVLRSPVPSTTALQACNRFLIAAQLVVGDMVCPSPAYRPALRLVPS
jgi:hypothetical protein